MYVCLSELSVFGVKLIPMATMKELHCPSRIIPSDVHSNHISTHGTIVHLISSEWGQFKFKLWAFGVTLVAMTTYMKVHCPSGIIPSGVLPNYFTTYGIYLHQISSQWGQFKCYAIAIYVLYTLWPGIEYRGFSWLFYPSLDPSIAYLGCFIISLTLILLPVGFTSNRSSFKLLFLGLRKFFWDLCVF